MICTIHRAHLVTRAVQSALDQTLRVIEVIVVVDGPDPPALETLGRIDESRLRVRPLPENVGRSSATNIGVAEARGRWIALLDDDDEWLPEKLEIQLHAARQSTHRHPIISCHFIARTKQGDLIWPRRHPRPGEHLSEYLFCQRGLRGGEGIVSPCTVLTSKDLLQRIPYTAGLRRLEDADWLLRAAALEGVGVEFVPTPAPLVIVHMEESHRRVSDSTDWRSSVSWVESHGNITRRAYASFLLTAASSTAAEAREWKAFWLLAWKAVRHGKPTLLDFLAHLTIWLIPIATRTQVAAFLDRITARGSSSADAT